MMRSEMWVRTLAVAFLSASGALAALTGCQPLPDDSLVDENDVTIRLVSITPILQDNSLTEAEKRQQLEDLGITDQLLIDALLLDG